MPEEPARLPKTILFNVTVPFVSRVKLPVPELPMVALVLGEFQEGDVGVGVTSPVLDICACRVEIKSPVLTTADRMEQVDFLLMIAGWELASGRYGLQLVK